MSVDSNKKGGVDRTRDGADGSNGDNTITATIARFGRPGTRNENTSAGDRSGNQPQDENLSDCVTNLPSVVNHPPFDLTVSYYEQLKANFLTRHAERPTKTILFTGTVNGEGTSSTAMNFAKALARDPELKVLLIDANLRNPSVHNTFSISHSASLAKLLNDANPGGRVPFRFEQGKVNVLPGGGMYSDPTSIFASREFSSFLLAMEQVFDFIVLDSPPVLKFSETRIIASKVDATILVLQSGKTKKQRAHRAVRELESAGTRLLGTVINRRKYYIPQWLYKHL
jgi:capsular exopolysaccharide synthesis family protein